MMVELREAKIFERKMTQPFKRTVHVDRAGFHFFEELSNNLAIHVLEVDPRADLHAVLLRSAAR